MAAPTSNPINRFIRGDLGDIVTYPAASGFQVNVGDLCCFASGLLWSATNFAQTAAGGWNSGTEIQNWSGARANYVGVALGQYNSYSTFSGQVPVALTGMFQYPFPLTNSGSTIQPGTFVSFTQNASSGFFQPQQLMQCSGQATAIGKVEELLPVVSSGQGIATVYLQSFLVYGGIGN